MSDNIWQIPNYEIIELKAKSTKYCICIPVINEGERLKNQLKKMYNIAENIDILILDGGSSDSSTDPELLKELGIRTLLIKKGLGKLSTQLRMGYAYALNQGYDGIITIDGNNKDNVEAIFDFVKELDSGVDFVQGSRYLQGGKAINTPLIRELAVKLIHIPLISFLAGFKYTDTTNGFRAYSRRLLLDPQLQPFRDVFDTYELLAYISVKAPKLGYIVKETPVTRAYPKKGKVPTKISFIRGNFKILKILLNIALGKYDVESK